MKVFGKYLQRYTPELVVKQFEEVALEELEDKEDRFDLREAQLTDIRQNQDGEDDPKTKDGPAFKRAHDDKHKDDGKSPLGKSNKDDGSQKDHSRKGSGGAKLDKSIHDEVIETGVGKEGSPDDAKNSQGHSKNLGSEQKLPSDNHSHTNKDAADSKGELGKEENKEMDEEERLRKHEEEERKKEVYSQLLQIRPIIKSLKKFHVSSLGNNYELCLHPEPIFKKHCILTKNGRLKYDQCPPFYKPYEEKPDMRVRFTDFSQIHKLRVNDINAQYRKEEISALHSTTLNSRFLDFEELFSLLDLNVICNLVESLDSFMFYRVLPKESKDDVQAAEDRLFLNQCIHVVRREDLLDEMNEAVSGFTAFDSLSFDTLIRSGRGLISDLTIDQMRQSEKEKFEKRQIKIKKIEEKRKRREEREEKEKARLEEERKLAEEWALKEKEASRSPAKAAALKLEKEKMEQEKLAKEKELQEKELQEKLARETQLNSANVTKDQLPIIGEFNSGNQDSPGLGTESIIKPMDADGGILESGIELQQLGPKSFMNPLADRFFRFGRFQFTIDEEWGWKAPYRIYRRHSDETPEQLSEALSLIVKTLVHYHDEEPVGTISLMRFEYNGPKSDHM